MAEEAQREAQEETAHAADVAIEFDEVAAEHRQTMCQRT